MKSMKDRVWDAAKVIPGKDPDLYREDPYGNPVWWDLYGKEEKEGWEVDHIVPRQSGGTNNLNNLQVLQYDLNRKLAESVDRYFRGRRGR